MVDLTTQYQGPSHTLEKGARLWRVDTLGGLDLLRARYVEFSFLPHAHEEFMIAVTEGGLGRPWFRGIEHRVGPGDVFVLNPGEIHAGGPEGEWFWQYRAFYPPAELMQRVVRDLTGVDHGIPQFNEDTAKDPHVAGMLRDAHSLLEGPGSTLEAEARLIKALAFLVERHAAGKFSPQRVGQEHRAVRRAKEYLYTLPGENVSLERLAHETGLSTYHLCRVFRKETGLSPHGYQMLRRLSFAKDLLAKGVPASQVAVEAGFYDQSHLTRHFKRVFGVTPGAYFA
jgi:AraC-like DNA-binding protein